MIQHLAGAVAACVVAFAVVYVVTPPLIRYLEARNMAVLDYHKRGRIMVPRPGGPALVAGIMASEAVLYAFVPHVSILAIMATTFLAFVVGLVDDRRAMGGWFKPVALVAAALPILFLGAYDTGLTFPLFGEVKIPLLYLGLVVMMISITGNTINSIDIYNGVASGFMVIVGFCLSLSLFVVEYVGGSHNYETAVASLPLGFVSLAFYRYHRYPSRIFPGDSGALTLGAMYGAIAIVGQVEIIAAIALLPAIFNSFLFLSSVKRVVEFKKIKVSDMEMTDDFKLKASRDRRAPITLVRIIASGMPMTDREITGVIFRLAVFSSGLAVITALLTGVVV